MIGAITGGPIADFISRKGVCRVLNIHSILKIICLSFRQGIPVLFSAVLRSVKLCKTYADNENGERVLCRWLARYLLCRGLSYWTLTYCHISVSFFSATGPCPKNFLSSILLFVWTFLTKGGIGIGPWKVSIRLWDGGFLLCGSSLFPPYWPLDPVKVCWFSVLCNRSKQLLCRCKGSNIYCRNHTKGSSRSANSYQSGYF